MFIRQEVLVTDLWKMSQGAKKRLMGFIEGLKGLVSKIHVPNAITLEAMRNTLWIPFPFIANMYTNNKIMLEDGLH